MTLDLFISSFQLSTAIPFIEGELLLALLLLQPKEIIWDCIYLTAKNLLRVCRRAFKIDDEGMIGSFPILVALTQM